MEIKVGGYYAIDHTNEDGSVETNLIYVTNVRTHTITEKEGLYYQSETVLLQDGKLDNSFYGAIHLYDWAEAFLEREATKEEVTIFEKLKKVSPPVFPKWEDIICGQYFLQ